MSSPGSRASAEDRLGPVASDCWPTPEQGALLRAALLDGDAARGAFELWKSSRRETLDAASRRLVPLLLANLERLRVEDPLLPRLRQEAARLQQHSVRLLALFADEVGDLEAHGVPTLLLKGAGLAIADYDNPALRPLGDADLLVPTVMASQAIGRLRARGFVAQHEPPLEHELPAGHALSLSSPNRWALDLHWHVLDACRAPAADADFWAAARPVTFFGHATRALGAADQLLHALVHGLRWCRLPPHRWIADAIVILRRAGPAFDWPRVVGQARARRLVVPVREGLGYLAAAFGTPVPEAALRALRQVPVGLVDRWSFQAKSRAPWLRGPLSTAALHADDLARGRASGAFPSGVAGLRAFASTTWAVPSLRRLPLLWLRRGAQRARQAWLWHARREAPEDAWSARVAGTRQAKDNEGG